MTDHTTTEVVWTSDREREVALLCGWRLRGAQVEMLRPVGRGMVVAGVRPASMQEHNAWQLLVTPEKLWGDRPAYAAHGIW